MATISLTEESRSDFIANKRVRISTGSDEFYLSEEGTVSSVGSNHPIHELIVLSDDDEDVESPPSAKIDESLETKSGVTVFRSTAVVGEIGLKEKEGAEEEDWDWFAKYGSMIVDSNGFLLGEFRRVDEELSLI